MKKIFTVLPLVISLSIFSSCQKQETAEERKAEVDREVQQRLDAEHQAQEKQQLAEREGELSAREKALADQQNSPAARSTSREEPSRARRVEEDSGNDNDATASYSTFYTKLDSYGDWRETSDYGYVFQPREAQSRTWRPYTDGHWVYTDAGWTWISEEPFGWATYHYGRWTRLRNIGWVWVPGKEWAPAWVSWRKSDDYVGWAPLPPEARFDRRTGIHNWSDNYYDIGPDQYSFVETKELGAPRLQRAIVPSERNVTIVNQTTNVTNITYNNTTVVNQGPNYDEVRARSTQPIQQLRLERDANVDVTTRPVVRGEVVAIPSRLIAPAQAVERPRTVKETVAQVVVERGWDTIADRQEAEKVRLKMKSEATPPANAPSKTFVRPTQAVAETSPISARATSSVAPSPTEALSATPAPTATTRPTFPPRPRPIATPPPIASPTSSQSASPYIERGKIRSMRKLMEEQNKTGAEQNPAPSSSAASPSASASPANSPTPEPGEPKKPRPRFESQALKFQPRQTVPMESPSPNAASPEATAENPGKGERRNRKREPVESPNENKITPKPTPTPANE